MAEGWQFGIVAGFVIAIIVIVVIEVIWPTYTIDKDPE